MKKFERIWKNLKRFLLSSRKSVTEPDPIFGVTNALFGIYRYDIYIHFTNWICPFSGVFFVNVSRPRTGLWDSNRPAARTVTAFRTKYRNSSFGGITDITTVNTTNNSTIRITVIPYLLPVRDAGRLEAQNETHRRRERKGERAARIISLLGTLIYTYLHLFTLI